MIIMSTIHLLHILSKTMPVALHELFHLVLTIAICIILFIFVF